jgi:hypothetical protein
MLSPVGGFRLAPENRRRAFHALRNRKLPKKITSVKIKPAESDASANASPAASIRVDRYTVNKRCPKPAAQEW